MRYATFSLGTDPRPRLGVLHDSRVFDMMALRSASERPLPATLIDLIQSGPSEWRAVAAHVQERVQRPSVNSYGIDAVRWHAPIPRPAKNVMCVGKNYLGHAEEIARASGQALKLAEKPVFFTKAPTTVTGPMDDVPWDRTVTQQVDWEVELAAVIGTGGVNIASNRALAHVFGYTIVNDITARDLQRSHNQFFKGKSLDGFCPMGPVVVTADEFGDPQSKALSLRVNGVEKQRGNTRDMIFTVAALIESLSAGLTLEPGDILSTGTPDGVGFARTPPEFLQDQDVVEAEVEGIGMLRNRIVGRA